MRIIRSRLAPIAAFAFPTRYVEETDTVQASFDGGTTWEDFPEGDPRKNNHTPPPDTADPRCDAAARIRAATEETANALIDQVDTSATVMPVVTGFLRLFTPLFTIIPYLGVAYALIQAILSIGSVALHSAFDSFDWDEFECFLYCRLELSGQFSDSGFATLLSDIASAYSDATETLLYNFYFLAGRAGLNDQAGIRTETGDCSSCTSCEWIFEWDFTTGNTGGWYIPDLGGGVYRGRYTGSAFVGSTVGGGIRKHLFVQNDAGLDGCHQTALRTFGTMYHGTGIGNGHREADSEGTWFTNAMPTLDNEWGQENANDTFVGYGFIDWYCDSNGSGLITVQKIQIVGTGDIMPSNGVRIQ